MRTVTEFDRTIQEIENLWIPLSDGSRLACRIWLPTDAEASPVPAVLEYIPYRKRDFTATRDEAAHRYFAGHGYAGVRVDLRGSGDSDGLLLDEYAAQELDDAVEIIAWLASRSWCNGSVGMMGNSWGGFNALQVAALRPPALKAIVTCCSTDDRYADDMHFMGGCLLNDNIDWGSMFFALLGRAPDPALVGDSWRSMWLDRLSNVVEPVSFWLSHQRRDDYWRHGSVCEDYASIECAVLAVGGWLDGYSNAIPRLLRNLSCPRQAIIGPWAHGYPHTTQPGPQIGFLQEALHWWDHWLKGIDNGTLQQPMLKAFMGRAIPAQPIYANCPGEWIAETTWPSPRVKPRRWFFHEHALAETPGVEFHRTTLSPLTTGLAGGEWCPYGTGGEGPEFPGDQREDDGKSICFDSDPLETELQILGTPVAILELTVDQPVAYVIVRLCDVAVSGASTRVSFGVLNLCHREGHNSVVPMVPGKATTVTVQLNDAAYAFVAGHRLRIAVSTVYWPMIWPAPSPVMLILHTARCAVDLPIRDAPLANEKGVEFNPPEQASTSERLALRPGRWESSVERDLTTGRVRILAIRDDGLRRIVSNGLEIESRIDEEISIVEGDPLSALTRMKRHYAIGRGNWRTRIQTQTEMACSATHFRIDASLKAFEGDSTVFERTWSKSIPRDGL